MNHDAEVANVGTTAQARPGRMSFDGNRGELAALLFRNLLLTLATFGIYRFWGNTRVRRFLWRHVKLLGEPLEYLGNGTELLRGFLIAIVFVAPLTTLFLWSPLFVPEGVPYMDLVLEMLYYGSLGILVQLAIYRVRRYRLTRTAWRGVRFGLDGSSLKYALIWCLYGMVTLATAGLAYPWLRVATTRYFANNVRFGTTGFSFESGGAFPLFLRWLVVIVPALAGVLLFILVNAEAWGRLWSIIDELAVEPDILLFLLEEADSWPLGLLLVSAVFRVWYRVFEFRYLVNSVRIGGQRLSSLLHPGPVYGIQYRFNVLFYVVLFIVGITFARATMDVSKEDEVVVALIVVLVAVAGYWLYGLCKILFVKISLLALTCKTLLIQEPEVLARAVQSTAALPGHGEGLADALDVGGF